MVEAPQVLLVATAGGHQSELEALAARVVPAGWGRSWLVPTGPQGDRLAATGEQVHRMRPTGPRDWKSTVANLGAVRRVLAGERPEAVLSTGAAMALPALTLARAWGAEAHYVESAARTLGPSLTGRLLRPVAWVHLYTQWPEWSDRRWRPAGSVFDNFSAAPATGREVKRLVVTLGTQTGYGFRRLVERLAKVVPPTVECLWQVGATDTSDLGIDGVARLAPEQLDEAMGRADAVIAHAGIGSALGALRAGKRPLLVPRRVAQGEHVDDHQSLIGTRIAAHDLASVSEADAVSWADIEAAAAWSVSTRPAPPLRLGGRLGAALSGAAN